MPEIEDHHKCSQAEDGASSNSTGQKVAKKGYLVNIRGVIPLYFFCYYFVILVGEDKRRGTQDVLHERRRKTAFAGNVLFFLLVIFPYVIIFVLFLYFFKQSLGIDIFPNVHWPNLVRDFFGW